jgi:hypothetical protein
MWGEGGRAAEVGKVTLKINNHEALRDLKN